MVPSCLWYHLGLSSQDKLFFGSFHDFCGDGMGVVFSLRVSKACLICQGVDQPGLAFCVVQDLGEDCFFKSLICFFGVLPEEFSDLLSGDVSQADAFRLDVEAASSRDDLTLLVRVYPVVSNVSYST